LSTDAQTTDAAATVATLLAAAGLTVPDNEVRRLAELYPGLRRSMDRFYEIATGDEVPAAVFRAAEAGRPEHSRAAEAARPEQSPAGER
jgi:hypothetical protein